MENFMIGDIECQISPYGKYYQVSTRFKGQLFAELFDAGQNSIQDAKRKFGILFNASRNLLRKKKKVLYEIWEKQGIHREIPDF